MFLLFWPSELLPTKSFFEQSDQKQGLQKFFFLDYLLTAKPLDRRPTPGGFKQVNSEDF